MVFELLKALFIGIVVAAPVGPVLLLVIQKTLCHSRRDGMYAGLGSMVADNIYAACGILALSVVRSFISAHEALIMIAGGALVFIVGLSMVKKKEIVKTPGETGNSWWSNALQTMGCAFSNPSAFAFMLAMLALCKIDSGSLISPVWLILIFIAAGEFLYWMFVTFALTHFLKISDSLLLKISRIGGGVMLVFGIVLLFKGLMIVL